MLAPLNNQERQHIASLRAHPLLANVATLTGDDLLALLLQRRLLSLSIVNVYECVIDALVSDAIKATVRWRPFKGLHRIANSAGSMDDSLFITP